MAALNLVDDEMNDLTFVVVGPTSPRCSDSDSNMTQTTFIKKEDVLLKQNLGQGIKQILGTEFCC